MTIVAYTSSLANPVASRSDKIIDLAETPLPISEIPVYGAAVDTEDDEAQWAYTWTILRQPPGPQAAWKNGASTVQNPILADLQVWGNYRLFLVATNLNTDETSETDPLRAPDSAFVHVRLKSTRKGIEKPAPGERNHWTQLWRLADLLESLESNADPDPVILSANIDGTMTDEGYRPGVIVPYAYTPPTYTGDETRTSGTLLHYFYAHQALRIYNWNVVLQDGGDVDPTTDYRFRLYTGTVADVRANTLLGIASADVTGTPAVSRAPLVLSKTIANAGYIEVPAGTFIAVGCVASPQESAGDRIGGGMSVTLFAKRVVS